MRHNSILISVIFIVHIGCINNPKEATVTFSASVNPVKSGDIAPDNGELFPLDSVALFAYPYLGYTFSHWNNDPTDSLNPKHFVMKDDSSITGNFNLDNFPKAYGGEFRDTPIKLLKKGDELFMIGDFRSNNGAFAGLNKGLQDFFLAKYNSSNGFEILGAFGGELLDSATDFYFGGNDHMVITGWSRSTDGAFPSNTFNRADIFVARLDLQGNILWKTTLGGSETDAPSQIKPYQNGYLISGIANSKNDFLGITDSLKKSVAFIVKLSQTGDIEWHAVFDGSDNDIIDDIQVLGDNSIIATGRTVSKDGFFQHSGTYSVRGFTFKLNSHRELQWITFHKDSEFTDIYDTYLLNDQHLLLTGRVFDPPLGDEVYIAQLDLTAGSIMWERTYGGTSSEGAFAVEVAKNGDIFLAGTTGSQDGIFSENTDQFRTEAFIVQLDAFGNYKSTFLLEGNQTDWMYDIVIDEPLIFYYGHTSSNSGDFDFRGAEGFQVTDIFFGATQLSDFKN